MRIELIYAKPDTPIRVMCDVKEKATVYDVVQASGIITRFDLNTATLSLGIYGKPVSLDTRVQPHDRVELYCSLQVDPKTVRLKRAKERK